MIVRKVRGKEAIHPVKLTSVQVALAHKRGVSIEEYVKAYLDIIAKKRRWKWWFERKKK